MADITTADSPRPADDGSIPSRRNALRLAGFAAVCLSGIGVTTLLSRHALPARPVQDPKALEGALREAQFSASELRALLGPEDFSTSSFNGLAARGTAVTTRLRESLPDIRKTHEALGKEIERLERELR